MAEYRFNRPPRQITATTVLVAVIVGVSLAAFASPDLHMLLALRLIELWQGQYQRLLTSMLVHGDLLHLLMNAVFIYIIGRPLEQLLGVTRYLGVFILSVLGGALAVALFGEVSVGVVGASGGAYGLLGCMLMVYWGRFGSVRPLLEHPYNRMLLMLLAVNIVISVAVPGISLLGHLGGLVVGTLFGYLMGRSMAPGGLAPTEKVATVLIALALAAATVYAAMPVRRGGYWLAQAFAAAEGTFQESNGQLTMSVTTTLTDDERAEIRQMLERARQEPRQGDMYRRMLEMLTRVSDEGDDVDDGGDSGVAGQGRAPGETPE